MLNCEKTDLLEIACVYHYKLQAELLDGTKAEGLAKDLNTVAVDQGNATILTLQTDTQIIKIDLKNIKHIEALTTNCFFKEIQLQ